MVLIDNNSLKFVHADSTKQNWNLVGENYVVKYPQECGLSEVKQVLPYHTPFQSCYYTCAQTWVRHLTFHISSASFDHKVPFPSKYLSNIQNYFTYERRATTVLLNNLFFWRKQTYIDYTFCLSYKKHRYQHKRKTSEHSLRRLEQSISFRIPAQTVLLLHSLEELREARQGLGQQWSQWGSAEMVLLRSWA